MEIEQNLIEQDMTMADDVRSMKEIIKMANSICPTLQFTGDCPGANTNNKLPILDMNCWVEDNCVLYEHYTKPMASSLVIPQRRAVPQKVKKATIAQMAVKILESTSLGLPWSRKAQLLSNLSLRIKQSGYNASFRLNIFKSVLKCWERRLQMDQSGDRPLHRERNWKREERQKEKERKKETWYTKKEENPLNASPIFCPPTPKSTLASSWKQIAEEIKEQSNGLVSPKIVEQGGVPLKNLVTRTSPMETDKYEKQDCPVCISDEGKNKQCLKTTQGGAGYTITCKKCRSDNIVSVYHGKQVAHYTAG